MLIVLYSNFIQATWVKLNARKFNKRDSKKKELEIDKDLFNLRSNLIMYVSFQYPLLFVFLLTKL